MARKHPNKYIKRLSSWHSTGPFSNIVPVRQYGDLLRQVLGIEKTDGQLRSVTHIENTRRDQVIGSWCDYWGQFGLWARLRRFSNKTCPRMLACISHICSSSHLKGVGFQVFGQPFHVLRTIFKIGPGESQYLAATEIFACNSSMPDRLTEVFQLPFSSVSCAEMDAEVIKVRYLARSGFPTNVKSTTSWLYSIVLFTL